MFSTSRLRAFCVCLLLGACGQSEPTSTVKTDTTDLGSERVPYGAEFWRRPFRQVGATTKDEIDLTDVVERVSHAFRRDSASELPVAVGRGYQAAIDDQRGLIFRSVAVNHVRENAAAVPAQEDIASFRVMASGATVDDRDWSFRQDTSWTLVGNTAQTLRSTELGIVEHVESRAEGVELAWVLNKAPRGTLTIQVQVKDLSFSLMNENGIHYADGTGTARVRVSHPVLVDSVGRRTALSMSPSANGFAISVPQEILSSAAYPIAIDPVVSPEYGIDTPVPSAPWSETHRPATAVNSSQQVLIVWEDSRTELGVGPTIYGARVSSGGSLLDPLGIRISSLEEMAVRPAVASNGTDYFVAWQERAYTGEDIRGVSVSSAGGVGTAIGVATDSLDKTAPVLTFNGSTYVAAWEEEGSYMCGLSFCPKRGIYAATVTSDGLSVGAEITVAATSNVVRTNPRLARLGSMTMAVWEQDSKIYGRVFHGGSSSELSIATATASQLLPAIASNGTTWLVVWQEAATGSSDYGIYARRIWSNGVMGAKFTIAQTGISETAPTVIANGNNWLVGYIEPSVTPVRLASVSSTEVVAATGASAWLPTPGRPSLVAFNSGFFLAVERDSPSSFTDVVGWTITSAGAFSGSTSWISITSNRQANPSIAASSNGYLVTWIDYRGMSGGQSIYAARLSSSGSVLDPNGIQIDGATSGGPAVAVAQNDYLVAYTRSTTVSAKILNESTGAIGARIDIASGHLPRVASNGLDYFVTYGVGTSPTTSLRGKVVSANGALGTEASIFAAGPSFLSNAPYPQYDVDWYTGGWIVVASHSPPAGNGRDIGAVRLTSGGRAIAPKPV